MIIASGVAEDCVQSALSDGRILDAMCLLRSSKSDVVKDDDRQISFLFGAAHGLLDQGNRYAAERCVEMALRVLADGGPLQQGLQFQEWLTLATIALLRQDWQSCGLWLRQVERSLQQNFESASLATFQKAAGDLFAIRACASAEQGLRDEAEALLLQATECHHRADAIDSAVRDLILLSRVLQMTHQWHAAESRLLEAEAHLTAVAAHGLCRQTLQRAIMHDRRAMTSQSTAVARARWN